MTTAHALFRSIANRAIHIQTIPRPSNIGESQEVLRLLSQFGEVEYFRNLRYDLAPSPNCALLIFKDEDAAQHCIKKSPIRFRMSRAATNEAEKPQRGAEDAATTTTTSSTTDPVTRSHRPQSSSRGPLESPFGIGQTRFMSTSSPSESRERWPLRLGDSEPPRQDFDSRIFQIMINPAIVNFRDQIETAFYYGKFENDYKKVPNQDLMKKVQWRGMANLDWRMKRRRMSDIQAEKDEDRHLKSLRELYEEHKDRRALEDRMKHRPG